MILETGFRRPLIRITLQDKESLQSTLRHYYSFISVKAEIDQFAEGLATFGVLDMIRQHSQFMRPLFVSVAREKLNKGENELVGTLCLLATPAY